MAHWECSRLQSPCLCGKGRFFVVWESENYPPFGQYFNASIECAECAQTYSLWVGSLSNVRVSKWSDHRAHSAAVIARKALWNSDPDVLALCAKLRAKLDAMPSQVARHRWLRERGLFRECLATFRREYRDEPDAVVEFIVFMGSDSPLLASARQRMAAIAIPEVPTFALDEIEWAPCEEDRDLSA